MSARYTGIFTTLATIVVNLVYSGSIRVSWLPYLLNLFSGFLSRDPSSSLVGELGGRVYSGAGAPLDILGKIFCILEICNVFVLGRFVLFGNFIGYIIGY